VGDIVAVFTMQDELQFCEKVEVMLRIEAITKGFKDFYAIEDIHKTAFPKAEQAPMFFLLKRAKKDYT